MKQTPICAGLFWAIEGTKKEGWKKASGEPEMEIKMICAKEKKDQQQQHKSQRKGVKNVRFYASTTIFAKQQSGNRGRSVWL